MERFDWIDWLSVLEICILALLLTGCTPISHIPTPGWPALAVTEHHVSNREMRDACVPYMPAGVSPMGCAVMDLDAKTCDIWLSKDFPDEHALEHERLHCLGHDHPGGTFMVDLLERMK